MEEKHFVSRKRLAQAAALAGAAGTLLALLLSALSGALAVRLFRYLGQARRTMVTLEAAAKLYLEEHEKEAPGQKKK